MPYDNEELAVKVIFIGNAFVGKSKLICRLVCDTFNESYNATIGVEFTNTIDSTKEIKWQIWDIGPSTNEIVAKSYYKGSKIFYICADLSSKNPSKDLLYFYDQVKGLIEEDAKGAKIVLVGTKLDLVRDSEKLQQSFTAFNEFQKTINDENPGLCISVVFTSAKTGESINNTSFVFSELSTEDVENLKSRLGQKFPKIGQLDSQDLDYKYISFTRKEFSDIKEELTKLADDTSKELSAKLVNNLFSQAVVNAVTNLDNTDDINVSAVPSPSPEYVIPHVTKKLSLNEQQAEQDLNFIAKEIERTKFRPSASNKNNQINPSSNQTKHVTRTTKWVYDSIQDGPKEGRPAAASPSEEVSQSAVGKLHSVQKKFIRANETKWSLFRSTTTTTFYRAFASPHDAFLAEKALRKLTTQLPPASDYLTGKIKKLYTIAKDYNGLTWQEALCKVEQLLADEILNNPKPTESLYQPAFEIIQTDYHNAMFSTFEGFKDKVEANNSELFAPLKDKKGKDFSSKPSNWKEQYKEALAIIETVRDKMQAPSCSWGINEKLQAFQYLACRLFEIAEEIPFGRRNGSRLYEALMCRISLCLGFDVDSLKIRKAVESELREHKICYQARAALFKSKYMDEPVSETRPTVPLPTLQIN